MSDKSKPAAKSSQPPRPRILRRQYTEAELRTLLEYAGNDGPRFLDLLLFVDSLEPAPPKDR